MEGRPVGLWIVAVLIIAMGAANASYGVWILQSGLPLVTGIVILGGTVVVTPLILALLFRFYRRRS